MTYGCHAYPLGLLAFLLVAVISCEKAGGSRNDEAISEHPVQLALSIGAKTSSSTKGNPAVITEMADEVTFRGMNDVTVLPFETEDEIVAGDVSAAAPSYPEDIARDIYDRAVGSGNRYAPGIIANNWSHLYPAGRIFFPNGTASVLAYGRAPIYAVEDEVRTLHLNGALQASGLGEQSDLRSAGDIHFDPVPIHTGPLPSEAQELAGLLNSILVPEVKYETRYWYERDGDWFEVPFSLTWDEEIDDNVLRECFLETTNSGDMMPGSGRSVEFIIARLYHRLSTYPIQNSTPVEHIQSGEVFQAMKQSHGTVPLTWGDMYRGLKDVLIDRIEALETAGKLAKDNTDNYFFAPEYASLQNYPSNLGLPEGAAILRWSNGRFYPVEDTAEDSTNGIAPVGSFCYPPQLWYFANSTLRVSNSDRSEAYTYEKGTWGEILAEYRYGRVVSSGAKSVALEERMQFSCGMLIASVSASAAKLDDGDDDASTLVSVNEDTFPVTGVIIGSQQQLNFDFTPAGGDSHFLYDDCVSGYFVSPSSAPAPGFFRTLVSQTPAGEDVYICLELRNDSGQSFVGADGLVLPGSKFYLLGSIEPANPQACVFQQRHTTTIRCQITSLAEARNAIPNLEQAHITLGIKISVDWVLSTPSHIILS